MSIIVKYHEPASVMHDARIADRHLSVMRQSYTRGRMNSINNIEIAFGDGRLFRLMPLLKQAQRRQDYLSVRRWR